MCPLEQPRQTGYIKKHKQRTLHYCRCGKKCKRFSFKFRQLHNVRVFLSNNDNIVERKYSFGFTFSHFSSVLNIITVTLRHIELSHLCAQSHATAKIKPRHGKAITI